MAADEQDSIAFRFEVFGRVQGVGFRYFVHETASRLGVVGWVRNRPDGSVEAWAEGLAAVIEQFAAALKEGPRMAHVGRLEQFPVTPVSHDAFRITN